MTVALAPETTRTSHVIPRQIGSYRIVGRLGKGGMGQVLRAQHTVLGREVALKVLSPDQAEDVAAFRRFRAEGRAQAAFSHRHAVTCLDAGSDQGWNFLAMELVDGGDLRKLQKRYGGRLPVRLALALMRDVALAVEALHQAGFLHRDLKPANILLTQDLAPKLADFGAVACLSEPGDVDGPIIGSPAYMAPEQVTNRRLDVRTDVYGLGATLHALLSGAAPFSGTDSRDVLKQVVAGEASELTEVPAEVVALVKQAMARDPAQRHASAAAFASAIDIILAGVAPVEAMDLPLMQADF